MVHYATKDSGKRAEYQSGMVRDTEVSKARFDLLFPLAVPYESQMLTRFAELMARGAEKYDARNWELAQGEEELLRYRSSALRHLIQWMSGENDEDHAAAVMFNILAGETVRYKMEEADRQIAYGAGLTAGLKDHNAYFLDELRAVYAPLEQDISFCTGRTCCIQCDKGFCCAGLPRSSDDDPAYQNFGSSDIPRSLPEETVREIFDGDEWC